MVVEVPHGAPEPGRAMEAVFDSGACLVMLWRLYRRVGYGRNKRSVMPVASVLSGTGKCGL